MLDTVRKNMGKTWFLLSKLIVCRRDMMCVLVHISKMQGIKCCVYERHTRLRQGSNNFLAEDEVEAFEVGLKHRWDFIFSRNQCFSRSLMPCGKYATLTKKAAVFFWLCPISTIVAFSESYKICLPQYYFWQLPVLLRITSSFQDLRNL